MYKNLVRTGMPLLAATCLISPAYPRLPATTGSAA